MAVSVKGAGVGIGAVVADGRPLGEAASVVDVEFTVRVQYVLVDGDVRHQHGVGVIFAAVHLLREPVEPSGVADLVDAVIKCCWLTRAAVRLCTETVVVEVVAAVFVSSFFLVYYMSGAEDRVFVCVRAAQLLPPGAVGLSLIQQPGHLAGGKLIGGFRFDVCNCTVVATDVAIGFAAEPVAVRYRVVVSPAHAADSGVGTATVHAAGVVAVHYRGAVVPAHAADSGVGTATVHAAGVVAVRYRAAVVTAHAADVVDGAGTGHAAGVVAVHYHAAVSRAYAAGVIRAFYGAGVVAVRYRASIVVPGHAADVVATVTAASHAAGVSAVRYCAYIVVPGHAADVAGAGHGTCVVAVRYRAAVVTAHAAGAGADDVAVAVHAAVEAAVHYRAAAIPTHAANVDIIDAVSDVVAYIAVSDVDVLHPAAAANVAEQTDIVSAAAVVQSADGVDASVKGAGVGVAGVADGRPGVGWGAAACNCGQHARVDGDVIRQHGVYVCLAAVYLLREPVELSGVADLVDAVLLRRRLV